MDRDPAGRAAGESFPSWVRTICRRWSRSPGFRRSAAPSAPAGSGATFSIAFPSASGRIRQLAMSERMCASPGMARASLEATFRIDARPSPADDHRANPGHPCPGRPRRSGAVWPLSRRPHPGRAVPRGRRCGLHALVHRARQDLSRDRGVPHRQPCGPVSVTSRPADRVVHRHCRVDATRRRDR